MRAGWLRHRITIQTPATVQSSSGQVTPGWSDYLVAWASIEPLRGREYMEGRQAQASVDHRIRIVYWFHYVCLDFSIFNGNTKIRHFSSDY